MLPVHVLLLLLLCQYFVANAKCYQAERTCHINTYNKILQKEFCSIKKSNLRDVKCFTTGADEMTTSTALVLYDEAKLMPHEKTSRHFVIGGHEFTISQNWQQLGVAAVVWDSAVVLAEYLHTHRHLVEGLRVVELGAGSGLAGLVAAALGADVTVTERAEALAYLTTSVNSNSEGKPWKISAQVLDWTETLGNDSFESFDVVLGADIIYIEDTFPDLLRTINSLALTSNVHVLLSCKLRYDRDLKFLGMLEKAFDVTELYFDESRKIQIFSIRKHS